MNENDERLRLRWGVKAEGYLIAAFVLKARAEDFAERGRRGTPPSLCHRIEVVFLGPAFLGPPLAKAEREWRAGPAAMIEPLTQDKDHPSRACARKDA